MSNNHDTESSDSDDHFSDAHSGLDNSGSTSPVPVTRVEKVDLEPSHGEVPGTDAYNLRTSDAKPDEIAVIADHEGLGAGEVNGGSRTPGGHPIPTTVVEKVDNYPSHGEIPGTRAHRQRAEDAMPDIVIEAGSNGTSGDARTGEEESELAEEAKDAPGSPTRGTKPVMVTRHRRTSSGASRRGLKDAGEEDDGGFGDDFDDFEEGEEDADFDDFDDGFQEAAPAPSPARPTPPVFSFPVLDFSTLHSPSAITAATEPYLDTLFPASSLPPSTNSTLSPPSTTTSPPPPFLTPRSASLWSQLVAPPPLQPPNWIRSRIRRLFLISLGVPIDLDEILPASSQKKLILPSSSLSLSTSTSPRTSTSLSRLKSPSTTSLDSQGRSKHPHGQSSSSSTGGAGPSSSSSKHRSSRTPAAPNFNLLSARQLCSTTAAARSGFTDQELNDHVKRLRELEVQAKEALEYWTRKTDETIGDREAFEGVIENLVMHARKVRK